MWIEHDGKSAPDLPDGTLVKVRFRDMKGSDWLSEPFEYWCADESDPRDYWEHHDYADDIVAYRVVSE